jgi:hypothetical protein
MKLAILAILLPLAFAQTAPPAFPANPLPVAVAAFGEFNQLGTPRWTLGIAAIYPVVGSAGIYGTTTADVLPKRAIDPATGRTFYAASASIRQGFHYDVYDAGRFSFLLGGDLGPSFASAQPSGININLSSSFVATPVYQVTPQLSVIFPVRMLYVSGIGWNPVLEMGAVFRLKK